MSRESPPKWALSFLNFNASSKLPVVRTNYLFITYIVTSKPKRISVAAGFVHIVFLLICKLKINLITNQIIGDATQKLYYKGPT